MPSKTKCLELCSDKTAEEHRAATTQGQERNAEQEEGTNERSQEERCEQDMRQGCNQKEYVPRAGVLTQQEWQDIRLTKTTQECDIGRRKEEARMEAATFEVEFRGMKREVEMEPEGGQASEKGVDTDSWPEEKRKNTMRRRIVRYPEHRTRTCSRATRQTTTLDASMESGE